MKRHKSENKLELSHSELRKLHLTKAKKLNKVISILTIFLIIVLSITVWVIYNRDRKIVQAGINSLRQTLSQQSIISKPQIINSTTGFSVTYSTTAIAANGLVFPKYKSDPSLYSNDNGPIQIDNGKSLNTSRAYVAVNFWTTSYEKKYSISLDTNPNFQMQLLTSLEGNIFEIGRQDFGSNTTNTEIAIKLFAPKTITTSYSTIIPSLSSESSVKIGATSYQKLIYKMANTTFRAASYTEIQYITVQNRRPFVIKLDITPNTTAGDVALLNQVITSITYTKPDSNIFSSSMSTVSANIVNTTRPSILMASTTTPLPQNSVNLPEQLSSNSLKIVAEFQPAVVRVGTIVCFNFNLLLPSGKTAFNVQGACAGGSGSGSIVSSNGYISTNGHVVIFSPSDAYQLYIELAVNNGNSQALENYLQYLINSGVATISQINKLINAIRTGDNTAVQTLLDLSANIPATDYQVTNQSSSYAIQLSNIPIKYKILGTSLSFEYGKYIVPAKLIGDNFNINSLTVNQINLGTYSSSDVALLKISGNNFPVINMGNTRNVHVNSTITAIGWPGFVDGGLSTTDTHTIPTATSGSVLGIAKQSSGNYTVIITSVPIAEGNSGGPAFDSQGQEIGLTTYVASSANPNSGITEESSGGIIRSINDFKALVAKNGVILQTTSQTSSLWNRVVNDFAIGHFKDAYEISQQVQNLYPENYLITNFEAAAKIQISEGHDTSGPNLITLIGEILILIMLIGGSITVFEIVRHRRHGKRMGYYMPPLDLTNNPYISNPINPTSTQPILPVPVPPAPSTPASPPITIDHAVQPMGTINSTPANTTNFQNNQPVAAPIDQNPPQQS